MQSVWDGRYGKSPWKTISCLKIIGQYRLRLWLQSMQTLNLLTVALCHVFHDVRVNLRLYANSMYPSTVVCHKIHQIKIKNHNKEERQLGMAFGRQYTGPMFRLI